MLRLSLSPGNRRNPDLTGADGSFGWDVIAGFYKVEAAAPGCAPSSSSVLAIPPPVTNLDLRLDCGSGSGSGGGSGGSGSSSSAGLGGNAGGAASGAPASNPPAPKARKHKRCVKRKGHHKVPCKKKRKRHKGKHGRRSGVARGLGEVTWPSSLEATGTITIPAMSGVKAR